MNSSKIDISTNEYLQFIVESLHMKMDNFMFFLLSEDEGCYEYIIYKWTLNLYEKGKKPEQALPIIYRARSIYLMHSVYLTPAPSEPTEKLKNLLVAMLPSNSNYKSLSKKEQEIVQQKIAQ